MSFRETGNAYIVKYEGSTKEKTKRSGLSYDYSIKLRKPRKERMDEERISDKQKAIRNEHRKEFLMKNLTNQRWPMSIQSIYRNIYPSLDYGTYSSRAYLRDKDPLNIGVKSGYYTKDTRKYYLKELIKTRKERAAQNLEAEFQNPLYAPLRGLDEDESDRDYMTGKEIRRELRTSAEFEEAFNQYVCEREKVDEELELCLDGSGFGARVLAPEEIGAGLEELSLTRGEGRTDEEFLEDCLAHAWSLISSLRRPDLAAEIGEGEAVAQKGDDQKVLKTLRVFVEVFKELFKRESISLDESILTVALSLHILNLNYFRKDLRSYMAEQRIGLKSIILTIGLKSDSQVIQEALIRLISDLSFSDFDGKKVNDLMYSDCREVLYRWIETQRWSSHEGMSTFMDFIGDLFMSQALITKTKEIQPEQPEGQKVQFGLGFLDRRDQEGSDGGEEEKEEDFSESEEEEKQIEHGMEDKELGDPLILKKPKGHQGVRLGGLTAAKPEIYHRKDDEFLSFISSLLYHVLNLDYQLDFDGKSITELIERSSIDHTLDEDQVDQQDLDEKTQAENQSQEQPTDDLPPEIQNQLQLEDDGIDLGSETTTECSEYSEDLIDERQITQMVIHVIKVISGFFTGIFDEDSNAKSLGSSYFVNPIKFLKNSQIQIKLFLKFLNNWMEGQQNVKTKGFKYMDRYIEYIKSDYGIELFFLTQIKFASFTKLDAKKQLEFLKKLTESEIDAANFTNSDFSEDLLTEILGDDMRKTPQVYTITNQTDGLWGSIFYNRPFPSDVNIGDRYNEEKWVRRAKIYEKSVDLLHSILLEGGDRVGLIAKFLRKRNSKIFVNFLRSILKPEIGHLLKTIHFKDLKRDDFLPFKQDNGYEVIDVDLSSLDYGDQVYSYKVLNDSEFSDNKLFRVYGRDSICTRADILKTREELQAYPDEYLYYEGEDDIEDEEDDEFAFDPSILQRARENLALDFPDQIIEQNNGNNGNHKDKDQPEDYRMRFRLKKYSILTFKTRKSRRLVKREKYDKMDNRVSTDMLRSGAAIIRKLRLPRVGFTTEHQDLGRPFIRDPLYYMFVPSQFSESKYCRKFHEFKFKRFFNTIQMQWDGLEDDTRNDYDCLYVKRLKKVVLRGFIFRERFLKVEQMLALERVRSGTKIVNFDDPEQRDPYYERLFKLKTMHSKKDYKAKILDLDNNCIPRVPIKPSYFCLLDFTTRKLKITKFDYFLMDGYMAGFDIIQVTKDGNSMIRGSYLELTQKEMKRGQPSEFGQIKDPQLVASRSFSGYDDCRNDVKTYDVERYPKYNLKSTRDEKTGLTFTAFQSRVTAYSDYDPGKQYYVNKPEFRWIWKDPDSGLCHFRVVKDGVKKIFRFRIDEDTRFCFSEVFRRLYLLDSTDEGIKLRVISFDAFGKFVNRYLEGMGKGE